MSDAVAPLGIVDAIGPAGEKKAGVPAWQLVLRAVLATYLLGAATTLAVMVQVETGVPVLGSVVFPIGLTLVVLVGLELVTGAFGIVPMAVLERRISVAACLRVFWWLVVGHLVGGLAAAWMITAVLTGMGTIADEPTAGALVDLAVDKTLRYEEAGPVAGLGWATLSAVLCNWLVALGVIMGFSSTSTTGKILAIWMPILTFFALGYEHAVVNFFVIPSGMMLGAPIGIDDWWVWNQVPVLVGNFIGGLTLAALGLYFSHRTRPRRPEDDVEAEDRDAQSA
ncbi:Formate/nitrite transporter FocA, FNT family [Georgenia satyanarayanai]|uniref:Formate/nitrite transporter FocA, FNT family n=1 Tax=Georgenia satyanarayanai TaxID=860221 RepID=A0A2Y9AD32_9MICO|nr:formate/nitrite transporter family protein [Georgenia satyanarayanai]PYF99589.1 formate/nitrite transporter FocA (FNT family) [Georgenia satyanarayanai]SSA42434.1 Formate/nitrite transporter FocA, FNT family [Georgenia satyanarayanai]